MAKIAIGDVTGTADITIGDGSQLANANLKEITAATAQLVAELQKNIKDTTFQSAKFGAVFQSPKITINAKKSLTVKAGTNCTLTRYTAQDKQLLGTDPTVPKIDIGSNDYWLSFGLQTTLEAGGTESVGSGLGVSVKAGSAVTVTSYSCFSQNADKLPTLGDAISTVLSNFNVLLTAKDIRKQKTGTVWSSDVSGTVTVSGSYSLPIGVNQLALAEALVPFKVTVKPSLGVKIGGSVALSGEYAVVYWRSSDKELQLALLKKKGVTLTGTFTAGAGLAANLGTSDLVETFFNAIAPGIDLKKCGLAKTDPRYKAINDVLTDSISRALSISVNATCAATFSDQAALVYSIDFAQDTNPVRRAATDDAINAALNGDWSRLSTLPNAKELRNVVGNSQEHKLTISVNLLGIFNYESVEDFVRSSMVVHDAQNASVTITDTMTAKRITTVSTPYLANSDKLRTVLYESNVATAAYALVSGKFAADFKMQQSMLIYKARMSAADLRKDLGLAVLVGEMTRTQLDAIQMVNPSHVLIDASQALGNDQMFRMFFSDSDNRTPHSLDALKRLGRSTLAALLDPSSPEDSRRLSVLNNDSIWQNMDTSGGKPPANSPASYSDWYDVTFWANAIHDAAKPLKATLDAFHSVPAGTDPSKNPKFMKSRDTLKKAIGEVTHDTHAAFELGWPIAVTFALVGGKTGATLKAIWNGVTHVPSAQASVPASAAFAKTLATRTASR